MFETFLFFFEDRRYKIKDHLVESFLTINQSQNYLDLSANYSNFSKFNSMKYVCVLCAEGFAKKVTGMVCVPCARDFVQKLNHQCVGFVSGNLSKQKLQSY